MGIVDEDIARVREAADIVAVISEHVQLKRVGRRWAGLCPFHSEKSPSFSVNAEQGLYYCFGCGAKGDVITFVREIDHLDFAAAVERLAAGSGITLRYTDADARPVADPHQIQHDALDRLKGLLAEHMSDERLLLTWFGQFMTEPRYPELVSGPEIEEADFLAALEDGAVLVRNPSARLAWSEVDVGLVLFASGQSRLLPAHLKELLRLICAADALHADNLAPWLADEDGRTLVRELVQQGSLEFADE